MAKAEREGEYFLWLDGEPTFCQEEGEDFTVTDLLLEAAGGRLVEGDSYRIKIIVEAERLDG